VSSHTLFISDLHLDDARPEATRLFEAFLAGEARQADALYILGDLFEYWLGDDVLNPLARQVADALAHLAEAGVPSHFIHGNRDFLIGQEYANHCGMQLLPGQVVVSLYGQPTLLLHGDELCTDDTAYQRAREQVRDPAWQKAFLARSPAERAAFARDARQRSEEHKQGVNESIMDVNQTAVLAAFARHGVSRMIHGHTHRPAVHALQLPGGPGQRIVLGDWYTQGSVLRVGTDELQLQKLEFN
jgi:UDP-2,3-diacylglucosamine hydrolase